MSVFLSADRHFLSDTMRWWISPAVVVAIFLARNHVKHFWEGSAKVPVPGMADGYNNAISKTNSLLKTLEFLMYTWSTTAVLTFITAS